VSDQSSQVPRFAHGSRVPGWDENVDLDKPPASYPDPAQVEVPDDLRAEIEGYMARYPDRRSASIPALHAVQKRYGWCTPEGMTQAAAVLGLTPAYLASVATFYDMLDTQPVGRKRVYVCTNISCSLLGGDALLAAFQEHAGDDDAFHVRGFECLGACDMAPMASVDDNYIGPIDTAEVPGILEAVRNGEDPLPEKQLRNRRTSNPHLP
jgi:NADH-quinone oxidoreductase subunit E